MWCEIRKGNNWFYIKKSNKCSSSSLVYEDVIADINFDDWHIYKMTNKLREATYDEVREFKNAGYFFYLKEHFEKNEINKKIDLLYKVIGHSGGKNIIMAKPLLPIEVFKKVRICGVI